jgi:hypothetical protein
VNSKIDQWKSASERIFGYTCGETMGRTPYEMRGIYPDGVSPMPREVLRNQVELRKKLLKKAKDCAGGIA